MSTRFTYSRWDGTQKGFELDADSLLEAVTDDLLYHGDVNSALRRLMQQGTTDRNGERIAGLREMLDKVRQRREEILERSDLGGVYKEISDALDDIVDEERHQLDRNVSDADASGDQRRADNARNAAAEKHMELEMLPSDLAGKVRGLQNYNFESAEAQSAFRGTDGQAARAVDAAVRRPDVRCDAEHDPPGHAAHEGHDVGPERHARSPRER